SPGTTQPSSNIASTPQPSVSFADISGTVGDPVNGPVANARVQAFEGQNPAGSAVVTDAKGAFDLVGSFSAAVTVHVTREGSLPAIVAVTAHGARADQGIASVVLTAAGPSQIASGLYALTITADPGCDGIPADLQTMTYAVTVSSSSDKYAIATASDAFPGPVGFAVSIANQEATFTIDGPALVRQLPGATYLEFSGAGSAIITNPP